MSTIEASSALADFAEDIGRVDTIAVVGAKTNWSLGGPSAEGTRLVVAPTGIVAYEPAEMTVRCGAATSITELNKVLGEHGQMVPFDTPNDQSTVGGAIAVGRSGMRRRKYGNIRDFVLQVTYVNAAGELITAGGPTVKNVSGYDLVRLMVGSLGTLGLMGELILRCIPVPVVTRWFEFDGDPRVLSSDIFDASAVLWNGETTWVLLEGNGNDIEAQQARFELRNIETGPDLPTGGRLSVPPAEVFAQTGDFVAELGVGLVHRQAAVVPEATDNRQLHEALKARMDPFGRLNPGRTPIR